MNNIPITAYPATAIIIAITCIVSYKAFEDRGFKWKLIFSPTEINRKKEWYRFFSAGLLHGDYIHLIFNMFVMLQFGRIVEIKYGELLNNPIMGSLLFSGMYILGLGASSIYSYFKHKNNYGYTALGASGAVSAVLFSCIFFSPTLPLSFIFIPFIDIPAIVMGIGYLVYSSYMGKKAMDNIGHDAHFWGAVWGFSFTSICFFDYFPTFFNQILTLFS